MRPGRRAKRERRITAAARLAQYVAGTDHKCKTPDQCRERSSRELNTLKERI